jgi:glycosyltransferase 2 family protein
VTMVEPSPGERPAKKSLFRRVWRALALVVAVLCLGHFAREVWQRWPQVSALAWSSRVLVCLLLSTLLTTGASLLDAWTWGWLLRGLGVPASDRSATGVFAISQFAKYIGNVGQHIGRVALAHRHGWQTGRVVLSLFIENGFALGSGALVVGASLTFGLSSGQLHERAPLVLGLLVGGWLAGTLVLRRLLKAPPAFARALLAVDEPIELNSGMLAIYLGAHLVSYACLGLALAISLWGVAGEFPAAAWKVPAAATASWLVGYLLPGAPAGIGVREASLTALLGDSVGVDVIVVAALIWRVSALLADAIVLGVGFLLARAPAKS